MKKIWTRLFKVVNFSIWELKTEMHLRISHIQVTSFNFFLVHTRRKNSCLYFQTLNNALSTWSLNKKFFLMVLQISPMCFNSSNWIINCFNGPAAHNLFFHGKKVITFIFHSERKNVFQCMELCSLFTFFAEKLLTWYQEKENWDLILLLKMSSLAFLLGLHKCTIWSWIVELKIGVLMPFVFVDTVITE